MMLTLMMFDWFECEDCQSEETSILVSGYAWNLSKKQWDIVYELLGDTDWIEY